MGKRKVPTLIAVIMVIVAILFDLINLAFDFLTFGLLNWFIDFCAMLVFSFWLWNYGVNLWGGRASSVISTGIVFAADLVPFGDFLFFGFPWTVRVLFAVISERKEEEESEYELEGDSLRL